MKTTSAPAAEQAMWKSGVRLVEMSTGSGRWESCLKASRRRMSARISNCLPTEREKELGMLMMSSSTSTARMRVKAS